MVIKHENIRKLEEQTSEVVLLYKEGVSVQEIAKKFQVSYYPVRRILRANGITPRDRHFSRGRDYKVDDNFLDRVDTNEKAYFLGWMMSDGCNLPKTNTVSIALKEEDREILYVLRDLLHSDYKISHGFATSCPASKKYPFAKFSFRSRKMCENLTRHGCPPRKSLILEFPIIDEKLFSHFLRGYFEGDGSVFFNKATPDTCIVSILGTHAFCATLQGILKNKFGINARLRANKSIFEVVTFQQSSVKDFLDMIYVDSGKMILSRKYEKYMRFLSISDAKNASLKIAA